MKRIKIEGFKGHWLVEDDKEKLFIETALAVPPKDTYGHHVVIFEDLYAALSPLGRRISAADEAEDWRTWNYNIPEFGSSNAPEGPDIYINLETSSISAHKQR